MNDVAPPSAGERMGTGSEQPAGVPAEQAGREAPVPILSPPPIDGTGMLDALVDSVRKTVAERSRWPDATYRLQFQAEKLTFRDAADIAPYLAQLGVSHLYASPYFKSQAGSTHGYDVVDHGSLNPALGSADDYAAMVASLRKEGLGQILDIVPNHMGIADSANALWTDVLENGPSSPYAHFFDINWHPIKAELENKVLLPLLEDQYGKVLEAGRLRLEYADGAFFVRYYETKLPIDPRTYAVLLGASERMGTGSEQPTGIVGKETGREVPVPILSQPLSAGFAELKTALGPESADLRELESILTALDYLPQHTETAPDRVAERHREKEVIKGRLKRLIASSPHIAAFIEQNLRQWNGSVDNPHSFDRLDELLNSQVYRLSHWKAAADEINYRRFFDVSQLAAVCTEQPEVFEEIHRLVFDLVGRGDVDGLRVDHIDGLYDPQDYLHRLQRGYLRTLGRMAFDRAANSQAPPQPDSTASESSSAAAVAPLPLKWEDLEQAFLTRIEAAMPGKPQLPLYVIVEKILGPEEPLPDDWPVAGTTGYDALNHITRLLVDPAGMAPLEKIYQRFINDRTDFHEVAYRSKLLIARVAMASDIQLLTHQLNRISERHRRSRDFTLTTLRVALREILACFPVYRTYIHQGCVSDRDRQVVYRAVAQAKRRRPELDIDLFDFIRDVLLLKQPAELDEAGCRERALFVGRFQQVTSPLIAKGIEDTAFYIYIPLVTLNEVGGDPTKIAISADEFHRENVDRLKRHPGSLIATTTHDTKRTEDTRARINVLSEVPHLWRGAVNHWSRLNRRHRREVDGEPAPSRNDEYLFYQTVVGTWPLDTGDKAAMSQYPARIEAYMAKAAHEAKQRTGWINPNAEYDAAVRDFVAAALDNHPKNRFLSELREFHARVIGWGLYSALSQIFFKLTSPGVPDIYQGEELWDFSLVDPDNRRPVDFPRRRELLSRMQSALSRDGASQLEFARHLADDPRDPNLKLFVIGQLLQFRRRHHDLFRHGQYIPLVAQGSRAEHLCAYAWRYSPGEGQAEQIAIAIAPRLLAKLAMSLPESQDQFGPPIGEPIWSDMHLPLGDLPTGSLKNLFTGETLAPSNSSIRLADALANFPVALLTNG